uniref:Uncharacterized protein n=1 Tax=Nicotiana tabacum TaxID=4097 RepID=A0A1S3XDN2_TOBAC|nr:uncharacterized protein LOC104110592 [Nicotiana tomentosiformis]XP_016438056.1 PREDICTED: uncharacterized protein LOC107764042 [Nicotiana tabacum]
MIKRTKVSITREKHTPDYVPEGAISFSDEDAEGIVQPHNDALVIYVLFNKSQVKHVLIDPGISANIIRSRVVEQLGLHDQIVPAVWILNGFNMACQTTKGKITLSVNIARTTQEMKFYLIEGHMRYNALSRRPWVHNMRAGPSTLHQAPKFPTPGRVKMIYRKQPPVREMFVVDEVISVPAVLTLRSKEPTKKEKIK